MAVRWAAGGSVAAMPGVQRVRRSARVDLGGVGGWDSLGV